LHAAVAAELFARLWGRASSHPPGSVLFTPAGDARRAAPPGWADFNNGDIFYGMPD
jgi:hypothetical protein